MQVVVMGCGRVGSSLALELDRAGHDVAIIDRNEAAFHRLGTKFRGRTIRGMGFDRDVLRQAGIESADAFAAVSSGDNSNIIAARVARELFDTPRVVARIYDAKRAAVYERLGIPTVATVPWTTERFMIALGQGNSGDWRDPSGAVTVMEMHFHEEWIGETVKRFQTETGARVVFIKRFGSAFLPEPTTVLQQDDDIYVAVLRDNVQASTTSAGEPPNEGNDK